MRPHTGHIAAALLIAWIIFVISRGELPIYFGILGVGGRNITAAQCGTSAIGAVLGTSQGSIPNIFPTVTISSTGTGGPEGPAPV